MGFEYKLNVVFPRFDTSIGGLIFADQFIQYVTYLDSGNIYGFGEQEHHTMKHDMNWKTWAMWSRDLAVTVSRLTEKECKWICEHYRSLYGSQLEYLLYHDDDDQQHS